jgi:hypothetical protein
MPKSHIGGNLKRKGASVWLPLSLLEYFCPCELVIEALSDNEKSLKKLA